MSQLTPEQQQQLNQLRDIHLPEPVTWFPMAVGWWIVLALILCLLIWSLLKWYQNRPITLQKDAIYLSAVTELESIQYEQLDEIQFASRLSSLLKRVLIYHNEQVEILSGKEWASYLKQAGFTPKQADFIAITPYSNSPHTQIDSKELQQSVMNWLKTMFTRDKR